MRSTSAAPTARALRRAFVIASFALALPGGCKNAAPPEGSDAATSQEPDADLSSGATGGGDDAATATADLGVSAPTCVDPVTSQAWPVGAMRTSYKIPSGSQTDCDANRVTSTCAANGLFSPPLEINATCAVTPKPIIDSFVANPTTIMSGDTSTLTWSTTGANLVIKLSGATVTGTTKAVTPATTTLYTLTATNAGGTASATVVVTVSGAPDDPFMVKIDNSLIPTGDPGVDMDMLVPTTEIPPPSDIGAFRTGCKMTHMSYDDPIVFPNQPGLSHLHTFFGNAGVNAFSTATSIATTGNSTCRGGTINRTAYWVPAMVDTRTHRPLAPMRESNFYYKTGYGVPANVIQPMPVGLRMIAGSAKGDPTTPSSAAIYACVWDGGNSNWSKSIPPDCPVIGTSWLIMGVDFNQCWDGVNLDSADHKSHMAPPIVTGAPNTGHCPADHPVAIPAIAYQILYPVTEAGSTKYWRLASDHYDPAQPGGFSGHADWFNGWKPDIVDTFVKNCDRAMVDCHSHLLGDGRAMVILP